MHGNGNGTAPLDSAKRERFAQEYLVDLNAAQAAIRAGYSPVSAKVTGSRLLADANVMARITSLRAKVQQRTEITVNWVIAKLCDVAERCMEPVPVTDRRGIPIPGEWTMHVAGATQALALLGKHLGMFVALHELTGKNGEPLIPAGRLAPEEIPDRLRALIGRN